MNKPIKISKIFNYLKIKTFLSAYIGIFGYNTNVIIEPKILDVSDNIFILIIFQNFNFSTNVNHGIIGIS